MATVAELETAIDSVTTAVAQVGSDVTEVLALLSAAQSAGGTVPQDAIDKLTAISASLATVDQSLKAVEPPPAG